MSKNALKAAHGFQGKKDSGFFRHITDHLLQQADVVAKIGGPDLDREILFVRATIAARHAERASRSGS